MTLASMKKLLSRQLEPDEIQIVIDAWQAEQRGEKYHAGRLGYAESLVRRRWLMRNPDGSVTLGPETRELIVGSK
jgi:hypothetical protein